MRPGSLVDAISWGGSVFAFNPSIPAADSGHSLARQPADIDTDSAHDWIELSIPRPGIVDIDPPFQSPTPTETLPPQPPSPTATITPTPTSTDTPEPTIAVVINEILADPDSENGDANNDGEVDDADDEFIEIINNSITPVDISEWSLADYLSIRHVFPEGSIIEPGCGLILFGGGTPSGTFGNVAVQVASTGSLGLNDNMEIVYLYDADQETITSISYGEEGGDDQSITRDPDIFGVPPLRKHSLASGSNGAIFSPGTMVNGNTFSGCIE